MKSQYLLLNALLFAGCQTDGLFKQETAERRVVQKPAVSHNLAVNFYWLDLDAVTLPTTTIVTPFVMIGNERFQLSKEPLQVIEKKTLAADNVRRIYIPFERKGEVLTFSVGMAETDKTYNDVLYLGQLELDRNKLDENPKNTFVEAMVENTRTKERGSVTFSVVYQEVTANSIQEIIDQRAKLLAEMKIKQLLLDIALLNPYQDKVSDGEEAAMIGEYNYELFSRVRQRIASYKESPAYSAMRQKFNTKVDDANKANVSLNSWLPMDFPALPRAQSLKIP